MKLFILVFFSFLVLGCASSSAPKDVTYIESKQMTKLIEVGEPQSVRTGLHLRKKIVNIRPFQKY